MKKLLEENMATAQFAFDAICFVIVIGGMLEIVRVCAAPWPVLP